MKMTKQQGKAKAKGCKTTNHQANFDTSSDTLLHVACGTTGFLLFVTILSGIVLSSTTIHAANPAQSNVTVNVNTACTASGGGTYSAKAVPGNTVTIAGSTFSTVCNDSEGYSIYAIGYGDESYDTPTNTQMIGEGSIGNIVTGTAKSGNTSNWAMQVTPTSGSAPTITNGFDSADFHVVPEDYTQVAKYTSTTASPTATGARIDAKYQAYVISTQAIGTYTGKVKYTMVHPNTAPAPTPPPGLCTDTATCMQTMTSCPTTATTVTDSRDGEQYKVQQLADGKCWMLDNLRLDPTNSTILNGLTTSNTHVDSASLTSLKSGNRSAGAQYASSGFVKWDSSNPSNVYNQAKANADLKDNIAGSYGAGSGKIGVYYNYCAASAGSYCYDYNSGTGSASYDLCPAGWRMPMGSYSGEYFRLYAMAYASNYTNFVNALSTPFPGYFNNGSPIERGQRGYFWSSTYSNNNNMYHLYLDGSSSYVQASRYDFRFYGYSVRCLLGS